MNHNLSNLVRIGFLLLDVIVLNFVLLGTEYILRLNELPEFRLAYNQLWMYCNAAWLLVSWASNTYGNEDIFSFEKFSRKTMRAYLYFLGVIAVFLFLNKNTPISRTYFIAVFAIFAAALCFNRIVHLCLYHYFRNKDYIVRKVVIIGYNRQALKLVDYLQQQPISTKILGFFEEEENVSELTPYPVFTNKKNIIPLSMAENVTEIFSTISPEQDRSIYNLIGQADQACIRFRIIPNIDSLIRKPVHIEYMADIPVLSLRREPLEDVGNRIKKRLFDIVVSFLIIVFILSWLIPLMALLIKLESRGPVFFVQKRSGKEGKPFDCYKFRSMRVNADSHLKQATKNDSRITRLGNFMRKTSIDELPQFFNVLKSDMSIVGPRPHMLKHTEDYSKLINQFMIRHFVKPGITGWAQVHGYRGETKTTEDMANRVKYDIWYLENWSLLLDTRIVFLTAFNAVRGEKNAY